MFVLLQHYPLIALAKRLTSYLDPLFHHLFLTPFTGRLEMILHPSHSQSPSPLPPQTFTIRMLFPAPFHLDRPPLPLLYLIITSSNQES